MYDLDNYYARKAAREGKMIDLLFKVFAVLLVIAFVGVLVGCETDSMVGRTCTNEFLGEDVFVVNADELRYSRVGVRRADGSTAWMGRNELSNCKILGNRSRRG